MPDDEKSDEPISVDPSAPQEVAPEPPPPPTSRPEPVPPAAPAMVPVCPTCATPLVGKFCHCCGEKLVDPDDYSLKKFGAQALDLLTHFDFKFFRSLRLLVSRPGFLTACYLRGNRKPYLKPLQLFLLVNVAYYFLLHRFGWDTFATKLAYHFDFNLYGSWARSLVDQHLAASGESFPAYQAAFNAASETWSKSLVILMIPIVGLFLALIHLRGRRHLVEHLVFSTHFMAFLLVFMTTGLFLTALVLEILGLTAFEDVVVTLVWRAAIFTYFFLALRTAYGAGAVSATVRSLAVALVFSDLLLLYRFILFVVCYLAV